MPCAPTKANGGRTRNHPFHAPDKWEAFKKYNVRDVETEIGIKDRLAKFPVPDEVWDEYHIDQEINDRGVRLDMDLVKEAIEMDSRSRSELTAAMKDMTALDNPNSVQQMKQWLSDNGLETDSLGKKVVAELIKTAPPELQTVLEEEIEALPNGSELLGIYPDNDIETWRDFLHYLAQALCSFAFINREGKLRLVQYGESPVCTINNTHRYSSSFSDFVTRYTAISSTNRRTNTAEYYSLDPDDGLTMNLETNPLLQFGLDETRSRILNNILNAISVIRYVPFDSETIGDPALEPGDVLTFTGGQADASQMAAITSITTKINGKCSLKCVGKNPRLAEAKSKNDKDITGLINSVESTKMATYSYMNAMPYTLGEEPVFIVSLEFATQEETDCEFKAAVLINVTAEPVDRSVTAEGTGTTILPEETKDENDNPVTNDRELETTVTVPVEWQEDGQKT